MAGLGAAGDKQRRVCTQRTLESFDGFGGTRREANEGVRSHIWSIYLTQSNPERGNQACQTASRKIQLEAALNMNSKRGTKGTEQAGSFSILFY